MRIILINSLITIAYLICYSLFSKDIDIGFSLLFLFGPICLYSLTLLTLGSFYSFKKDKKGFPFLISSAMVFLIPFTLSVIMVLVDGGVKDIIW